MSCRRSEIYQNILINVSTDCLNVLHCSGVIPVVPIQDSVFVPVTRLYKKAVFIQCDDKFYVRTFPSGVIDD